MKKFLILPFLFLVSFSAFSLDFNCDFIFDEGVSFCQVTRIEVLEDRSNFVRENMMLGAYFSTQTVGLPLLEVQLDVGAYYPFYQAFNGMKQATKNV